MACYVGDDGGQEEKDLAHPTKIQKFAGKSNSLFIRFRPVISHSHCSLYQ